MKLTRKQKRLQSKQLISEDGTTIQLDTRKPTFRLKNIQPLTKAQLQTFEAFQDNHLLLHGMAGTGKTFISLYLALQEVSQPDSIYKKIYLIRSVVPTREQGFLPGSPKDKAKVYEAPYYGICAELYGRGDAYDILKQKMMIEFESTSYVRGRTFRDCIVVVDEASNLNFQELDSVMTRVGENCKIIFAGDLRQSDFERDNDRKGLRNFMRIIEGIPEFVRVEFNEEDIVRSKLIKAYLIRKDELGL